MLLELCVTELEDVASDSQSGRLSSQPVVVESSHPYTDDTSTSGTVKIPGNTHTHAHTLSHAHTLVDTPYADTLTHTQILSRMHTQTHVGTGL